MVRKKTDIKFNLTTSLLNLSLKSSKETESTKDKEKNHLFSFLLNKLLAFLIK